MDWIGLDGSLGLVEYRAPYGANKTSQELRMLSTVTLNCQVTMIVANLVSQLSEL